jgi:hypothetical protein
VQVLPVAPLAPAGREAERPATKHLEALRPEPARTAAPAHIHPALASDRQAPQRRSQGAARRQARARGPRSGLAPRAPGCRREPARLARGSWWREPREPPQRSFARRARPSHRRVVARRGGRTPSASLLRWRRRARRSEAPCAEPRARNNEGHDNSWIRRALIRIAMATGSHERVFGCDRRSRGRE